MSVNLSGPGGPGGPGGDTTDAKQAVGKQWVRVYWAWWRPFSSAAPRSFVLLSSPSQLDSASLKAAPGSARWNAEVCFALCSSGRRAPRLAPLPWTLMLNPAPTASGTAWASPASATVSSSTTRTLTGTQVGLYSLSSPLFSPNEAPEVTGCWWEMSSNWLCWKASLLTSSALLCRNYVNPTHIQ